MGTVTKNSSFDLDNLDAQLAEFEAEERKRLGLDKQATDHWFDPVPSEFTAKQRENTTLLICGLTMAHDLFLQAALSSLGYKVEAMDVPSNAALQFGREFGNRGQCNPTYFTVGNLVKHLTELREAGESTEDIVKNYVFLTAGACGPCRFGTYVTEYRKALRDSGFDGFRVLLFQQKGGLKQATGEELGLKMDPPFFWQILRAILCGDVLNGLMYRIRPYEVVPGSTNKAIQECKDVLVDAFHNKKSVLKAILKARKILSGVQVDRTKVKPKVGIIGEFWAMTTEGDGNYQLQKFLESEGAEVDIQFVTAWILYMVWQGQYDTRDRARLRGSDFSGDGGSRFALDGVDVRKKMISLAVADKAMRGMFQSIANLMGLSDYHLADMDELADVSHAFYDNNLRGGEGHMEVGKLILNVAKQKVNMTLSVKPFGCMPSSSVSDGVQSLISEMFPGGIFLPIETNGDGAVNVYSRVQMQLFKAKQLAQREVDQALKETGLTIEEVREFVAKNKKLSSALYKPPHVVGCTAADLVYDVAERKNKLGRLTKKVTGLFTKRKHENDAQKALIRAAKAAAHKAKKIKVQNELVKPIPATEGTTEKRKALNVLA